MTNPFYVASGTPATSSFGASQPVRSEFLAIQGGFDKFPDFTGSAPGTFLINNFTATGITTAPGMIITSSGLLGIGTSTPGAFVDIAQSVDASATLRFTNPNPGVNAAASFRVAAGSSYSALYHLGDNVAASGVQLPNAGYLASFGAGLGISSGSGPMLFATGNSTEKMRIDTTGAISATGPLTLGKTGSLGTLTLNRQTDGLAAGGIFASAAATYIESRYAPLVFLVGGGTTTVGNSTQRMIINNGSGDVSINGGMLEICNAVGGPGVGRIGEYHISNAYGGLSFYVLNNSSFILAAQLIETGSLKLAPGSLILGNSAKSGDIQFNRDGDGVTASRIYELPGGAGLTLESGGGGSAMIFRSGSAAPSTPGATPERMRIDSNGFVGINLTNPTDLLHIQTDASKPDAVMIQTAADTANAIVRFRDVSPGQARYCGISFLNNAGVPRGQVVYGSVNNGGAPDAMLFLTAGVERMRIDASGNVGIGTNNPLFSLHIELNQNTDTRCFIRNVNTGNGASAMFQMGNDATSGILMLCGSGYGTSTIFRPSGTVLYANGFGGLTLATRSATPIYFHTQDALRMRIEANGDVSVTTGALRCSYGYSTQSNQTPVASNTLVNSGISFSTGLWLVHAYLYGVGTASYSACAVVVCDGLDARAALINQGSLLLISVSGLGLYGQQNSGVTQTINWLVTKFYG
jgi:hypothetical protein